MTGTVSTIDHVLARDGTRLLVRRWRAAGEPWASLLLVHGLGEHSGRYEHVGAQFADAGIETEAFDLRGFGGSSGRRAYVDRWSQLHDDLEERLVGLRSAMPGRPLVLYGHSLGGLILLGYVLDARSQPDLLVLSAPALEATIDGWKRVLARVLARFRPTGTLPNGIDPETLMADPQRQALYLPDPLNVHRTTLRFAVAGFDEQARVRRSLDRLAIPTLVIHGGMDRLVPTDSSAVCEGLPGVTRRVYDGVLHELHNESTGPAVMDEVVAWIRVQASRLPGALRSPSVAYASGERDRR